MALDQADLFGILLPIEKKFSNLEELVLLDEEISLKTGYNAASVFFLGLEKFENGYVIKTRFHTDEKGSKMYRFYFELASNEVINYTGFSFGTNTHRAPVEGKKYSFDNAQIHAILQEVIAGKFITTPKVKGAQNSVKKSASKLLEYSQTCPICSAKNSSDGFNCNSCGAYNSEGLGTTEYLDDKKLLELGEVADREMLESIRVVKRLNFLPNSSDIEKGEFIFSKMYINGSTRTKVKVLLSKTNKMRVFINSRNWTSIYIQDKRKFGHMLAAVKEIKKDFSLAES